MGRRCVIVSGGTFSPVEGLRSDDFVIACDRGYTYCDALNLRPDLVISDFDSYCGPVDSDIPLNTYASEKDDTDTMLAARYAVEHGFQSVLLCCALGGRLDHLIANLQTLVFDQRRSSPSLPAPYLFRGGRAGPSPCLPPMAPAAASRSPGSGIPFLTLKYFPLFPSVSAISGRRRKR